MVCRPTRLSSLKSTPISSSAFELTAEASSSRALGNGKTTAVHHALESLGLAGTVQFLSARWHGYRELIGILPEIKALGTVIIDDFHKLDTELTLKPTDFLKLLADEEGSDVELIIVGINKAGDLLNRFAEDITKLVLYHTV